MRAAQGDRQTRSLREPQHGWAGPINTAVLKIAPMVTQESDTATAMASRYKMPTVRTGTPRAWAMSGLTALNSSGR